MFGPFPNFAQLITDGMSICALGPMDDAQRKKRIAVCARNRLVMHLSCRPAAFTRTHYSVPRSDEDTIATHLRCFERLVEVYPFLELFLPFVINNNGRIKTTHVYMISTYVHLPSLLVYHAVILTLRVAQMNHHAHASLSTDVHTIKDQILTFIPTVTTTRGRIIEPLPSHAKNKVRNFGYYSLSMGRLCTAIDQVAVFDKDPQRYVHASL